MAELIYIPINSAEESPFHYIHTIHRALFTLKKKVQKDIIQQITWNVNIKHVKKFNPINIQRNTIKTGKNHFSHMKWTF